MSSAANKDEALTCASIAREALSRAPPDTARAERFAEKAVRLYACPETTAVLLRAQAMAAEAEARGGGGAAGGARGAAGGSGSGGAAAAANGGGMRHRPHASAAAAAAAAPSPSPSSTSTGHAPATQEQVALVSAILRATTHYDVLSVPRSPPADDDAIKRAYRRLALRLHPDKCRAPRAEEAFKAVSRAFSVLSDPDKRAYYDRTGHDSHASAASAAAAEQHERQRQRQQRGGYGGGGGARRGGNFYASDEIDPDEIFNMFFGGNPFGSGVRTHTVYRTYGAGGGGNAARPQPGRGAAAADAAAARAGLASLAQLLPLLLVVFLTLFSSRPEPAYVLAAGGDGVAGGNGQYREGMVTARLSVPFFVRSSADFSRRFPQGSRARLRVDREIEGDYYDRVHVRCSHEMLSKQRAAAWGGRAARERAAAMPTPFCDELGVLNEKIQLARFN